MSLFERGITDRCRVFNFKNSSMEKAPITPGACRPERYLSRLKGKRVAFVGNQTSSVNGRHTLDFLLENGVEVVRIFGPEHGFREMADDATPVKDRMDTVTGLPWCRFSATSKNRLRGI